MIVLALKDLLESGDGLFNGDQLAGVVGENLSDLGDITLKINICQSKFKFFLNVFPISGHSKKGNNPFPRNKFLD